MGKQMIVVVAALHAKGFVHLDLKPENLMVFPGGKLKLIDVDGCVRNGDGVSIHDPSVSYTPFYCAPDFARFVSQDISKTLNIQPSFDVWSIGITICELVELDVVLKPMYVQLRNQHKSTQEALYRMM